MGVKSGASEGSTLHYGDNLDVMRLMPAESVDLIYLDPPFQSGKNYNLLFEERDGRKARAQIRAFEDTWEWDVRAIETYDEVVKTGSKVGGVLEAFKRILGGSPMLAYLSMMAPRLIEMRRLLKESGSIYLHCDPTASAHLRLLMDAVFGAACFRNEIIWSYRRWPTPANYFQRMHDVILFYSRSPQGPGTFNVQYEANSPSYTKRFKGKTQMLNPETQRKVTLEEESKGLPMRDVWDISIIAGSSKERIGYPTQKPLALLKRIVEISSSAGQVVLDPFCGCGTTIDAAQRLNRKWIGIDITPVAIKVIQERLNKWFPGISYGWTGEPHDVETAQILAQNEPHQFQEWITRRLDAWPADHRGERKVKKGKDRGIDGVITFMDGPSAKENQRIIISVKGGKLNPDMVRALLGTVEIEKARMGVLVSMNEPTREMRVVAADAGDWRSVDSGRDHPRIQLLTVADIFKGKGVDCPSRPIQQNLPLTSVNVVPVGTPQKAAKKGVGELPPISAPVLIRSKRVAETPHSRKPKTAKG